MTYLKNRFLNFLEKKDLVMSTGTDLKKLQELIGNLRPIKTEHELIRMGGLNDGGYLIPDDLTNIYACFSPGVDATSSFELSCLDKGMKLFLADASVDGVGEELIGLDYDFEKKFIGIKIDEDFLTLDEWVDSKLTHSGEDLLLQMDIEGAEYETLIALSRKLLSRFRIICIELHHIGDWVTASNFKFIELALSNITRTHTCVHIHPNNTGHVTNRGGLDLPNTMEFTFLRNDRIAQRQDRSDLPHELDIDCIPSLPHLELPKCWYK